MHATLYLNALLMLSCNYELLYVLIMCVCMRTVRLYHPPIITDGPHNQTVHVDDSVRFSCDVLSDPEYYLQWLKHLDEDVVVNNETRNFIVLHVRLTLLVPSYMNYSDLLIQ